MPNKLARRYEANKHTLCRNLSGKTIYKYEYFCNFRDQPGHTWDEFEHGRTDPHIVASLDCRFQKVIYQVVVDFLDPVNAVITVTPSDEDLQLCYIRCNWADRRGGVIIVLGPYDQDTASKLRTTLVGLPAAFPVTLSPINVYHRFQ